MHIIIGGAHQGKLAYAEKELNIPYELFCDLRTETPSENDTCYCHVEAFVLRCVENNSDPAELLRYLDDDSVVISDDISGGIVPMDPTHRAWREATGRLLNELCRRADRVTRIFCGLPLELK